MKLKLSLPALIWLGVFFCLPFLIIVIFSFGTRGDAGSVALWPITLDNYFRLFDSLYFNIFWNSFRLALLTTTFCALLAYPIALFIYAKPAKQRGIYIFLVMLPFFTNFLVRVYAWFILLKPEGLFSKMLAPFGIEMSLLNTEIGILIGLVYGYLPMMVLPIYSSLDKMEPALLEAAMDLGASSWKTFWSVILPLTRTGFLGGCLIVFIPVLGEFIVPKMLGGGKIPVIGTLIEEQFLGRLHSHWPFGAAITTILLLSLLPALWARLKYETR